MARLLMCECKRHVRCSECGYATDSFMFKYDEFKDDKKFKFCPFCGVEFDEQETLESEWNGFVEHMN